MQSNKIQQKKSVSRSNGRWTKTENDRFMKGLQKYGRDWISVQKIVKTRTLSQVRSHAQKIFMKMCEEDIEALIREEGKSDYEDQEFSDLENIGNGRVESKRAGLRQRKISSKEHKNKKRSQPRPKQNLLELFKKAIQHETLQIMNNSSAQLPQSQTNIQLPATPNQNLIENSIPILPLFNIFQENQTQKNNQKHSQNSQQKQEQASQAIQMQFVGLDFKDIYTGIQMH